jgi:hypothetical protein
MQSQRVWKTVLLGAVAALSIGIGSSATKLYANEGECSQYTCTSNESCKTHPPCDVCAGDSRCGISA